MDNYDFNNPDDAFLTFDSYDQTRRFNNFFPPHAGTWPVLDPQTMSHTLSNSAHSRRLNSSTAASTAQSATTATAPLQTDHLSYAQAIDPATAMVSAVDWHFQLQPQQNYLNDATFASSTFNTASYGGPYEASPTDLTMPTSQALINTTLAMDSSLGFMASSSAPLDHGLPQSMTPFQMADFQNELMNYPVDNSRFSAAEQVPGAGSMAGSSPSENWLEVRSLSSSDNGWNMLDFSSSRRSFESLNTENSNGIIFNPHQTLHIRTNSGSSDSQHSDVPRSAHSFSSWEEIQFPLHSPQSETNLDFSPQLHHQHHHGQNCGHDHHFHTPPQASVSPAAIIEPMSVKQSTSSTTSPSSSLSSPPARKRKSPIAAAGKVAKTIVKKTPAHSAKKDGTTEKKVGRRRGPLRPDQRQQAHEIRKLRACLRCKFLKKTCDKGDPCAGCQPSHARLWQVPCTRIDIKDIAYFMKDWKADFERHVSLGFSVGNIKGFSTMERPLYITHGYGYFLPINAREVYVRDDKCFGVDWVESLHETPREFEVNTAKLSAGMEGVSRALLSEYLDRHIDGGFEQFVDEYFEGTYFLTEILKTAYRYYLREKLPVLRKALKLVLAYNLTLHICMVEGLSEEEAQVGKVENLDSKFLGKTLAPVMINFQVKCALADMWRDLQKDVLEELSALYSSVYSGDKLKNWPTIFMLAAILLAVWELMQFDCHYRVPDQGAVQKFCNDMESIPVGVVVGLFSAISQKLPSFTEWDTKKHHQLLNSNPAVCDAMTEVRAHVTKYESYLRTRSDCKFDRNDFDSLSNKFLAKLVIRAN